jgi:ribulose 1,5-bisphosphate synthetase/thiazole synthase
MWPIHPKDTLHLHLDWLHIYEQQCAHRTDFNAHRAFLTAGAKITLNIAVEDIIVENSVVGATGCAYVTADAVFIYNRHDSSLVDHHCLGRTCHDALGRLTVLAQQNVKRIPGHVFDDHHPRQAWVTLALVIE